MTCLNLNDPAIKELVSKIGYNTLSQIIEYNGIEILDIIKEKPFQDLKNEMYTSYQYQLNNKKFDSSIDKMNEISFWRMFTPSFYNWFGNWMIQYKLQNGLTLSEKEQDVLVTKYESSYDNLKADISKVVTEDGLPKLVYHGSRYNFSQFDINTFTTWHFGTYQAAIERLEQFGRMPSRQGSIVSDTIKPYFLNIKNIIVGEDTKGGTFRGTALNENEGIEYINNGEDKGSVSYAIKYNEQAKSVILPSEDMSSLLIDNLVETEKISPAQAKQLIPIKFLNPSNGEIMYFQRLNNGTYGFVTPDGKVFIDKSTQSLNTPFHEFYHIYDKIILSNYDFDDRAKSIIDRANELAIQGGYLDKVKKLDAYKNNTNEQQLAEARAMLIGDAASSKINEAEHGFLMKLKSLLKDLVDYILDLIGTDSFKDYSPEEILNMSMDKFTSVMTYEMLYDKSFNDNKDINIRLGRSAKREGHTIQNIIVSYKGKDITGQQSKGGINEDLGNYGEGDTGGFLYVIIPDAKDKAYIGNVSIPKELRSKGIGKQIYQTISNFLNLPIHDSTEWEGKTGQSGMGQNFWKNKKPFIPNNITNFQNIEISDNRKKQIEPLFNENPELANAAFSKILSKIFPKVKVLSNEDFQKELTIQNTIANNNYQGDLIFSKEDQSFEKNLDNNPYNGILDFSKTEDVWIAKVLSLPFKKSKELKNRKDINEHLKNVYNEITSDSNISKYILTDFSDGFIDFMISEKNEESNEETRAIFKNIKTNAEARKQAVKNLQTQHLRNFKHYQKGLDNDTHYSIAFKIIVLNTILKVNVKAKLENNKIIHTKTIRGKNTTKSFDTLEEGIIANLNTLESAKSRSALLDQYIDYKVNNKPDNVKILKQAEPFIYQKTDNGIWYKFDDSSNDIAVDVVSKLGSTTIGQLSSWCTSAFETAKGYIDKGALYIYFSFNEQIATIQINTDKQGKGIEIGGNNSGQAIYDRDIENLEKFIKNNPKLNLQQLEDYKEYKKIIKLHKNKIKDINDYTDEELIKILKYKKNSKDNSDDLIDLKNQIPNERIAKIYNVPVENVYRNAEDFNNSIINNFHKDLIFIGNDLYLGDNNKIENLNGFVFIGNNLHLGYNNQINLNGFIFNGNNLDLGYDNKIKDLNGFVFIGNNLHLGDNNKINLNGFIFNGNNLDLGDDNQIKSLSGLIFNGNDLYLGDNNKIENLNGFVFIGNNLYLGRHNQINLNGFTTKAKVYNIFNYIMYDIIINEEYTTYNLKETYKDFLKEVYKRPLLFSKNENAEVKGFYNKKTDEIIINGDKLNPDKTIYHELVHRFLNNLDKNSELYKTIEPKLKELIDYIKLDNNLYNKIKNQYNVNEVNEELIAIYIADIIDNKVKPIKDKHLIDRINDIINSIIDFIKSLPGFNNMSVEQIKNLKVKEFADILSNSVLQQQSEIKFQDLSENQINYSLKAISIISNNLLAINRWFKQLNNTDLFWDKLQQNLQIPKKQIELLKNSKGNTIEEKLLNFITNYSQVIEINVAIEKRNTKDVSKLDYSGNVSSFTLNGIDYLHSGDTYTKYSRKLNIFDNITKKEFEQEFQKTLLKPTQYYSNLTVNDDFYKNNPDWEYKEQRITTPLITPSIKGHAQFAESNDIGWFRAWYNKKTGEVHVLETQSDLFQKGRDKSDLSDLDIKQGFKFTTNKGEIEISDMLTGTIVIKNLTTGKSSQLNKQEFAKLYKERVGSSITTKNDFLQLLNKDNNWVTFFIKSIIQDSAKKGYEKVLFPRLDTIIQIESEGKFKTYKEAEAYYKNENWFEKDKKLRKVLAAALDKPKEEQNQEHILRLKEQIASHQPSLLNTADFYEYELSNRLDDIAGGNKNNRSKGIWALNQITDEYSNTWNEITIIPERDLTTIQFQSTNQIIPTQQSETYDYIFEKLFDNFKPYVTELITDRERADEVLQSYDENVVQSTYNTQDYNNDVNETLSDLSVLDKIVSKLQQGYILDRYDQFVVDQAISKHNSKKLNFAKLSDILNGPLNKHNVPKLITTTVEHFIEHILLNSNHYIKPSDLKDIVIKLQAPLAIFQDYGYINRFLILTDKVIDVYDIKRNVTNRKYIAAVVSNDDDAVKLITMFTVKPEILSYIHHSKLKSADKSKLKDLIKEMSQSRKGKDFSVIKNIRDIESVINKVVRTNVEMVHASLQSILKKVDSDTVRNYNQDRIRFQDLSDINENIKQEIKDFEYTDKLKTWSTKANKNNILKELLNKYPNLQFELYKQRVNVGLGSYDTVMKVRLINNMLNDNNEIIYGKTDPTLKERLFSNKTKVLSADVLQNIANDNNAFSPLAKKILSIGFPNLPIHLIKENSDEYKSILALSDNKQDFAGMYRVIGNDKNIYIVEDSNFRNSSDATIIHEILHAMTWDKIHSNNKNAKQWETLYEDTKIKLLNEGIDINKHYPMSNSDEFLTGIFTNMNFIQLLSTIKGSNKTSIYEDIINWFKKILNIENNSLYDDIYNEAMNLLLNNDISTNLSPVIKPVIFNSNAVIDRLQKITTLFSKLPVVESYEDTFQTVDDIYTKDELDIIKKYLNKNYIPGDIYTMNISLKQRTNELLKYNHAILIGYNAIQEKFDSELEEELLKFLKPFNIDVNFINNLKETRNTNSLGITNLLKRVIDVSNNRDVTTLPEEISHVYVEFLGYLDETKADLTYLLKNVHKWNGYKKVYEDYYDLYNGDETKIKKEAIAKAISEAIVQRWKARKGDGFYQKILKVIDYLRQILKINFDIAVDDIANNILNNNTHVFSKLYTSEITKGKEIANFDLNEQHVDIIKSLNNINVNLTGSAALRMQGKLYRNVNENLHDLEFVTKDNIEIFKVRLKDVLPDVRILISNKYYILAYYKNTKIEISKSTNDYNTTTQGFVSWLDIMNSKYIRVNEQDINDIMTYSPYQEYEIHHTPEQYLYHKLKSEGKIDNITINGNYTEKNSQVIINEYNTKILNRAITTDDIVSLWNTEIGLVTKAINRLSKQKGTGENIKEFKKRLIEYKQNILSLQDNTFIFSDDSGINSDSFLRYIKENNINISEDVNKSYRQALADLYLKYINNNLTKIPQIVYTKAYSINSIAAQWQESLNRISIPVNVSHANISQYIENVMLHEFTHALTSRVIEKPITDYEISYRNKVIKLWEKAIDFKSSTEKENFNRLNNYKYKGRFEDNKVFGYDGVNHYGLTDPQEFIAEAMSNPEFQEYLSTIPSENNSLLTEIYLAIKELILNINKSNNSLLDDILNETFNFLENNSIEDRIKVNNMIEQNFIKMIKSFSLLDSNRLSFIYAENKSVKENENSITFYFDSNEITIDTEYMDINFDFENGNVDDLYKAVLLVSKELMKKYEAITNPIERYTSTTYENIQPLSIQKLNYEKEITNSNIQITSLDISFDEWISLPIDVQNKIKECN